MVREGKRGASFEQGLLKRGPEKNKDPRDEKNIVTRKEGGNKQFGGGSAGNLPRETIRKGKGGGGDGRWDEKPN